MDELILSGVDFGPEINKFEILYVEESGRLKILSEKPVASHSVLKLLKKPGHSILEMGTMLPATTLEPYVFYELFSHLKKESMTYEFTFARRKVIIEIYGTLLVLLSNHAIPVHALKTINIGLIKDVAGEYVFTVHPRVPYTIC